MQLISSRYYTSLADIQTVPKILLASPEFANRTSVRYARDSQIRAFNTANVILLGSRRANPWSELFEPQLNLVPEWENHSIRFRNKSPLPGESFEYVVSSRSGTYTYTSSYSVIAFLPNLEHNGNVLLLGGAVMEGTEASGDLLTNPVLSSRLVHDLALKDGHGHRKYFEVLFHNVIIGGIAKIRKLWLTEFFRTNQVYDHHLKNGSVPSLLGRTSSSLAGFLSKSCRTTRPGR